MRKFVCTLFLFSLLHINHITNALNNETVTVKPKPKEILPIESQEPKHLSLILEKLRKEQAQKCDYGSNPLIFDICQSIDKLNLANYHFKSLRVEDVVKAILKEDVVKSLQTNCAPGEWCLNEKNNKVIKHPLGKSLMRKHTKMLCLFSSCYSEISAYISNCLESELSKNILETASFLCDAKDNEHKYCLEQSLQLFHVSTALLTHGKNGSLSNVCENTIFQEKRCSPECKTMALKTNKMQSCCLDPSLLKSFKPLNWITDSSERVDTLCDLPITSLCFSDGKYYIGISPNVVIVSVVATILITTILIFMVYICLFNNKQVKISYPDSINYSQLNNDVEEEMNLVRTDSAEDLDLSYNFHEKLDSISQQGISRFVNQHQTNIKDLLN